jgi:hypothetical protein
MNSTNSNFSDVQNFSVNSNSVTKWKLLGFISRVEGLWRDKWKSAMVVRSSDLVLVEKRSNDGSIPDLYDILENKRSTILDGELNRKLIEF